MQEVLISYIQFLWLQISGNALLFWLILLGIPVIWLILRLTNILYEEKALFLGSLVFGVCSIFAVILLFTIKYPQDYYKSLLLLLVSLMTFLCVAPIFCDDQKLEINPRRRVFVLDGNMFNARQVSQVSVKRCFTRTKRSCQMEIYITEEGQRARSIYYETNDLNKFREVINFFKSYINIDYDCTFTQFTIEIPMFSFMFKVLVLTIIFFSLILPATLSYNDKKNKQSIPKYDFITVPKQLYTEAKNNKTDNNDLLLPIFNKKNIQIIIFDSTHSSPFAANYKKALYTHPNQSYDFNTVFITKKGFILKTASSGKEPLSVTPENSYTKFITENCKRFCLLDNESKVLYATDLEPFDPRVSNVQEAVNMLAYVQGKQLEQKRINEANRVKKMKELEDEDDYE